VAQGLILCGGHTEITDAVTRPVIAASVAGTVQRSELVEKKRVRPGDRIVLTKGLAIEGTSIIAREIPDRLLALGMSRTDVERCRNFLTSPGISIVREARIAASSGELSAMHDITEGGLSTALLELSTASGHRIRVYPYRIPIYPETAEICRLLNLSPLGLIASGSLIVVCRPTGTDKLIAAFQNAGIDAVCLGEILNPGTGVDAMDADGNPVPWPEFAVDEITRISMR